MHLKILGTRGEIEASSPSHKLHSGILLDHEILLDLGEKEYLDLNPKAIILTHLHPDHAYFVRKGSEEPLPRGLKVYSPEPYLHESLTILDQKKRIRGYTVTPLPTHHSKRVKSQAYWIKKGKRSFLYTGDLVWIDHAFLEQVGRVDLVITEASFIRKGGMVKKDLETGLLYGHNGIPNLIHLFKPYTDSILFTHFGSWFYEKGAAKKIEALGKENAIKTLIGFDGMEVIL